MLVKIYTDGAARGNPDRWADMEQCLRVCRHEGTAS